MGSRFTFVLIHGSLQTRSGPPSESVLPPRLTAKKRKHQHSRPSLALRVRSSGKSFCLGAHLNPSRRLEALPGHERHWRNSCRPCVRGPIAHQASMLHGNMVLFLLASHSLFVQSEIQWLCANVKPQTEYTADQIHQVCIRVCSLFISSSFSLFCCVLTACGGARAQSACHAVDSV